MNTFEKKFFEMRALNDFFMTFAAIFVCVIVCSWIGNWVVFHSETQERIVKARLALAEGKHFEALEFSQQAERLFKEAYMNIPDEVRQIKAESRIVVNLQKVKILLGKIPPEAENGFMKEIKESDEKKKGDKALCLISGIEVDSKYLHIDPPEGIEILLREARLKMIDEEMAEARQYFNREDFNGLEAAIRIIQLQSEILNVPLSPEFNRMRIKLQKHLAAKKLLEAKAIFEEAQEIAAEAGVTLFQLLNEYQKSLAALQ